MKKFYDNFSIKNLTSMNIKAEDIGLDKESVDFLKENYNNYSIKDLSELVDVPTQLLKAFMTSHNIASYTLNDFYPDGYAFCGKCKRILPYDNFYKNRAKKNGRQTFCKECDSNRKKEKKHPDINLENKPILTRLEKIMFIKKNYTSMTAAELSAYTGLSQSRIRQIAAEYNIKKYNKTIKRKFKECCSCKRLLPIDRFNCKSTSSDGYTSRCKDCIAIYRRLRNLNKDISIEEINKITEDQLANKDSKHNFAKGEVNNIILTDKPTEQKNMTEKELMLQRIQNKYKNNTISKKKLDKLKERSNSNYINQLREGKYMCNKCHKVKSGTEFYYSKRDGKLETICKQCKNKQSRETYLEKIKHGTQW